MSWDDDKPLPEDEDIAAAFPTRSGRHDTYAEAMRMVGAKRSKGALVALVNWLLVSRTGSPKCSNSPYHCAGCGGCVNAGGRIINVRVCSDACELRVRQRETKATEKGSAER